MEKLQREVLRMELQMTELIRMVANLNERIKYLEQSKNENVYFTIKRFSKKT